VAGAVPAANALSVFGRAPCRAQIAKFHLCSFLTNYELRITNYE